MKPKLSKQQEADKKRAQAVIDYFEPICDTLTEDGCKVAPHMTITNIKRNVEVLLERVKANWDKPTGHAYTAQLEKLKTLMQSKDFKTEPMEQYIEPTPEQKERFKEYLDPTKGKIISDEDLIAYRAEPQVKTDKVVVPPTKGKEIKVVKKVDSTQGSLF